MTEPTDITIVCIACHLTFTQRFREIPESGVVEATCTHCHTGWGLDSVACLAKMRSAEWHAWKYGTDSDTLCGAPYGSPITTLVGRVECSKCRALLLFQRETPSLSFGHGGAHKNAPTPIGVSFAAGPTPSHAPAQKEPEPPPPTGWGPVLTLEKVEEICAHIEKAMPMDWACHLCDVSPETLTSGRKKNPSLDARIEKARAKGGASLLGTLHADTMANRNTTRSTFLLERLHPKHFHLPTVITGPGGAPVGADPSEREPPVKRRWMLNFMAEHGRWPNADEHPPGEEPTT